MNDELKKLGLRVRQRTVSPAQEKPGKIAFDDLGNAKYEWSNDRLTEEGEGGDRARQRALTHHGLTIMDEEPAANAPIRNNTKGLRVGYNPYESGLLANKDRKKKTDLRELSKWIEAKKKLKQEPESE